MFRFLLLFNMGLPMIIPAMMLMVVALIPIVLLEAFVISKNLTIGFGTALWQSLLSNFVSTIFGIPITWFLLFMLQLISGGTGAYEMETIWGKFLAVTWQSPWVMPSESLSSWMVPAAMLFLLVPFFFASWYIEFLVMRDSLARSRYEIQAQSENFIEPEYDAKMAVMDGFAPAIKRAVRNANIVSYTLLCLITALSFVLGLFAS
jgi:hypothetical protein